MHTHKTARAEMLYAMLVEGLSPLGSAFKRRGLHGKEVQDTDGDGLPEFVDAWGEPLQFFRWPVYYGGPLQGPQRDHPGHLRLAARLVPVRRRQSDPRAGPARPEPAAGLAGLVVWPANPSVDAARPATTFSPSQHQRLHQQCKPQRDRLHELFPLLVDPNPGTATSGVESGTGPAGSPVGSTSPSSSSSRAARTASRALASSTRITTTAGLGDAGSTSSSFPNTSANRPWKQNALALIYIENQASVSDPAPSGVVRLGSFYRDPPIPRRHAAVGDHLSSTPRPSRTTSPITTSRV